MDEILYLEPDEEITSVIDKIKGTKTGKLGLVVPREATLLQSVVNLRLLLREAAALGKEIAIVTQDKIGRNLAMQIGIPVFNSIEEETPVYQPPLPKPATEEVIEFQEPVSQENAELNVHHFQEKDANTVKEPLAQAPVRREEKHIAVKLEKEKDHRKAKKFIWPVLAIVLVLILISSFLLLPSATVAIFVPSEDLKKNMVLTFSSEQDKTEINKKVFAGKLLNVSKEKEGKYTATGKKTVGEKAKGKINVYNSWESSSRSFPAGTKFSSSSKTFIAPSAFSVPGSAIREGNLVPGTVSVDIEAENPGSDYNVKAGRFTIFGLPAAQQEKIYGQSAANFSGGESREVQVVSQEDYDKAKNELQTFLDEEANKEIEKKAEGKKVLEKAVSAPDAEIVSSAKVDQEAGDFTMKMIRKKEVMVFDMNSTKKSLEEIIQDEAPSDKMVTIAKDEDVGFDVRKVAYDKKEMEVSANVVAKLSTKIDDQKIKPLILGKSEQEAVSLIKNQDGISNVEIKFSPSWWFKKIPSLERNVKIRIEYVAK